MDTFRHADVERLIAGKVQWAASIFLPTHRTGTAMQQDPIRLKNLLREAEKQVLAAGVRKPDVASMLASAEDLLSNSNFWQYQSDGLAVFASADRFESFRVPLPLQELVIVARRFQVKPLFPLLTGDGHFYILALSQNEARLLEATRHSVDEIEVERLPDNFRQAVGLNDAEQELQFHTGAGDRGGQQSAMYFGHGVGGEITKELLAKYFRKIDDAICELLKADSAPLLLAGVDYYFPIYREVSRYRQLVDQGVSGSPDRLRPQELHQQAWPIVEPLFRQAIDEALARFRQVAGTGMTSTRVEEILSAAHQGRVEVAFVATDRQQWGIFDPQTQAVKLHEQSDAHNEDLTDRAAIETYLKRGVVYALPSGDLPDGAALAAVYRY